MLSVTIRRILVSLLKNKLIKRMARYIGHKRRNRANRKSMENEDFLHNINDFNLAWNGQDSRFEFCLNIEQPLEWGETEYSFAGVFSGSNDRGNVSEIEKIKSFLQVISKSCKITLLSVIGGSYFLDLLEEVDFHKIILFDSNVAEFAKVSTALNILADDPQQKIFYELERLYRNDNSSLMPVAPKSYLTWNASQHSSWNFEGINSQPFPIALSVEDYPMYGWNPDLQTKVLF